MNKWSTVCVSAIVVLLVALSIFFLFRGPLRPQWVSISAALKSALLPALHREVHVPAALAGERQAHGRLVYVLGGNFHALSERFGTAVRLMKQGLADTVAVPRMPRWHIYSGAYGRKVGFDEWVVHTLGQAGISPDRIVFIELHEGFWGTKSEARAVARFLPDTDFHGLILVTSAYHTRRAYLTFQKLLAPQSRKIYVYGSNGRWRLGYLLLEAVKLFVYRYFVLAVD